MMAFGVDMERTGTRLMLHLVYQVGIHRPMREVVAEMMAEHGYTRTVLYSCMKYAMRPILEAEDCQLAAFGVGPLKKRTVTELAAALAKLT